ncbi:MAG: epoxyqueuosine reductase [Eubacteriales bacterium]
MTRSYLDVLHSALAPYGIDRIGLCAVSELSVANIRMNTEISGRGMKSAAMFLMPYYVEEKRNIAAYACPRDYHAYAAEVTDGVIKDLKQEYPSEDFAGYSDNSPYGEVKAAALSGLGVIGDNGLLLTPDYGSYVNIGGIYSTLALPEDYKGAGIRGCEGCGACLAACPVGLDKERCLSRLSQKKGELTDEETRLLRDNGILWGCDICQQCCPHNVSPSQTGIEYFRRERVPILDSKTVEIMSEEDFQSRAYAWRGKKTILRNLKIHEI